MKYQGPARLECTPSLIARLHDILNSGEYTNNVYTKQFEQAFKELLGIKGDCIAVNSCTSGLMLVLKALDLRKPLISDFTFSATAHACHWACGRFELADCGPESFNLNIPSGNCFDSILATHVFGNPCNIDELLDFSFKRGDIPLLFDSAHALGATYRGQSVANYGTASVFSLSPTKCLTSLEGGIIVSNSPELSEKLRSLRNYGNCAEYDCLTPGLNARLSEVHSIIGLESLADFPKNFEKRQRLVALYKELLGLLDGSYQGITHDSTHAYKDFSILLEPKIREKVCAELSKHQVEWKRYFRPISSLSCYRGMPREPMAKYVFDRILQLPLHCQLDEEAIKEICKIVKGAMK